MGTAKKSVTEGIKEREERALYSPSKTKEFTADNLDAGILLDRLKNCVREITGIRETYESLDEYEYDEPTDRGHPDLPWNEWQPELRALKHRHIERRHQLLGQVLTDLLDVIFIEVGLKKADLFYADEFYTGSAISPQGLDEAARSRAVGKGA